MSKDSDFMCQYLETYQYTCEWSHTWTLSYGILSLSDLSPTCYVKRHLDASTVVNPLQKNKGSKYPHNKIKRGFFIEFSRPPTFCESLTDQKRGDKAPLSPIRATSDEPLDDHMQPQLPRPQIGEELGFFGLV